jgi:hypothetical protein
MQTEIWKRQISITAETDVLLDSLGPFLTGEVPNDWRDTATPEQYFAVAFGWHLRALRITDFEGSELVEQEYARRLELVGPDASPNDAEEYFMSGVRGVDMVAPGSLMVDELSLDTRANIYFRVVKASEFIRKMRSLPLGLCASIIRVIPDQAIIDLMVLRIAANSTTAPDDDELLFLAIDDIQDWVVEGLKAIGEDEFANTYVNREETSLAKKIAFLHGRKPERVIRDNLNLLSALDIEPRDVLEYREKHGLRVTDPFWTTNRVQDALRLGLN